jgi:hypothetical protein
VAAAAVLANQCRASASSGSEKWRIGGGVARHRAQAANLYGKIACVSSASAAAAWRIGGMWRLAANAWRKLGGGGIGENQRRRHHQALALGGINASAAA